MPLIPIIPQRKTKNRLLFSLAGVIKLRNRAANVPIMRLRMLLLFHCRIRFPTKYIEAIIRPKKKAQIRIGECKNRYLNRLAMLNTLAILPPNTLNKKYRLVCCIKVDKSREIISSNAFLSNDLSEFISSS